jgi:hypothetical protein
MLADGRPLDSQDSHSPFTNGCRLIELCQSRRTALWALPTVAAGGLEPQRLPAAASFVLVAGDEEAEGSHNAKDEHRVIFSHRHDRGADQ